jgi:hypothetical protein
VRKSQIESTFIKSNRFILSVYGDQILSNGLDLMPSVSWKREEENVVALDEQAT